MIANQKQKVMIQETSRFYEIKAITQTVHYVVLHHWANVREEKGGHVSTKHLTATFCGDKFEVPILSEKLCTKLFVLFFFFQSQCLPATSRRTEHFTVNVPENIHFPLRA